MGKNTGKTILTIAGFFVGAGGWGQSVFGVAGAANASLIGGLYGAALASSLWTATHQESQDNSSTSYAFDQIANTVSARDRIPIIYGTRKWGGNKTYHKTASDKKTMIKDIVWCEGDIDSISDIRANDLLLSSLSGCSVSNYVGNERATPDTYLTTGSYRGCAWSRFSLTSSDSLSGDPTVTAIIKGKKITDTRTGAYAYSENCAMAVRDYLLSKRYGAGHFIDASDLDEDSFKEVADYCDTLVTTRVPDTLSTADAVNAKILELQRYTSANNVSGDELTKVNDEIARLQNSLITIQSNPVQYTLQVTPRYSLNMIINEDKTHIEILSDMLAVFGGFLVYCNGKVSLRCEKASSSCYDFNDSNIVQDTLKHTQYPIDSSPNRYSVTFYDPDNQYTGVKVLVEDTVNQRERSKIINKEVDLKGCTSQSQALRLARMYRDKVLASQVVITFDTATQAMHLEPGDVITVSHNIYPNGQKTLLFDKIPFRILEIAEENETYSIKAEQYNASIYNDALGAQIQVKNYVQTSNPFNDTIPNVSKISFSQSYYLQKDKTSVSALSLSTTIPSYPFFDCLYIYGSTNNGVSYTLYGTSNDGNFIVNNAMVGKNYKFKIVTGNTAGRKSTGFITESVFITGKDSPPNNVTDFVVCEFNYWLMFSYTSPKDVDFNSVEIRYGGSSWETSKYFGNIVTSPSNIINAGIPDGTIVFRAKAIDNGGNYSESETTYVIDISDVNFYKNVIIDRNDVSLKDGELIGLTRLATDELISSYSLEFDDCDTFDDLPIDYFAEWSGNIQYLSPVIDTYKIGKTGINFIFDYDFYDSDPTFDSFPDRNFDDYPFDTFDHITVITDISTYIKMSNDATIWGEWQLYQPWQYNFRYIQYRFDGTYESQECRAEISKLLQYYDVPDLTFSQTIQVPATGIDIVFKDYGSDFYMPPKEVSPTVIGGLGNVYPDITNLTANGLTITCYDRTGTKVSGAVLLVCKGY